MHPAKHSKIPNFPQKKLVRSIFAKVLTCILKFILFCFILYINHLKLFLFNILLWIIRYSKMPSLHLTQFSFPRVHTLIFIVIVLKMTLNDFVKNECTCIFVLFNL